MVVDKVVEEVFVEVDIVDIEVFVEEESVEVGIEEIELELEDSKDLECIYVWLFRILFNHWIRLLWERLLRRNLLRWILLRWRRHL
jgi:hypothetical protein